MKKVAHVEIINEYGSLFTYVHNNNLPQQAISAAQRIYLKEVGDISNAVQITIKMKQEEKDEQ